MAKKKITKKDKVVKTPPVQPVKSDESANLLTQLQKDIALLKKDRDMLLQVADKKSLSRFYSRHREALPPTVKLRMIDGKVIIGWRTIRNEVFKDMKSGKWHEYQTIELLFEDSTSMELPYTDYVRRYDYVDCRRSGTITDDKGNLAFKLTRLDNGKKYIVDVRFVN